MVSTRTLRHECEQQLMVATQSSRLSQFTRVSYSARKSAPRPISTRPASVATSIAESTTTDFECVDERLVGWSRSDLDETAEESEDLEISDAESIESLRSKARKLAERFSDSDSSSGRPSYDSASEGARTCVSITSYDEIPTPQNQSPLLSSTFAFDRKDTYLHDQSPTYEPIEFSSLPTIGPKGPHLFRTSINFAALPPLTIQTPVIPQSPIDELPSPSSPKIRPPSELSSIVSNYTIDEVRGWSTSQVCAWMRTLGFESTLLEKFERNDITGALLVDLKWEDLKELEISSFGKRVALWSEIHHLRNGSSVCPSEDSSIRDSSSGSSRKQSISSQTTPSPISTPIRESMQMQEIRGSPKPLPLEILTGVGPTFSSGSSIEDAPSRRTVRKKDPARRRKAHKVVRRKIEEHNYDSSASEAPQPIRKRNSMEKAPCRVHSKKVKKDVKHKSDTPSASGTILIATTASVVDTDSQSPRSAEAPRSAIETRPSSIVVPSVVASSDVLGAIEGRNLKLQEQYLRELSRVDPQENVKKFLINQHVQHLEERRASPPPVPTKTPADIARASATRLTLQIPKNIPPRSDSMSAPVDGFSPIERGKTPAFGIRARAFPISQCGASPVNRTLSPSLLRTTTPFSEMDVPTSYSPGPDMRNQSQSVPPDMRFRRFTPTPAAPATIAARKASIARNFPSMGPAPITTVDENTEWAPSEERKTAPAPPAGANLKKVHSGWMKKRKTNWFRHEWPEYHFELQGTRLGYAKNVAAPEEGFIDMDNYSVACSNNASTKLSAAFKSLRLKGERKGDDKAFLFQLVPAGDRRKVVNGKVHYFTVGTREERIDWMRELMLAKAIKQKGQGFDVEVNGRKI